MNNFLIWKKPFLKHVQLKFPFIWKLKEINVSETLSPNIGALSERIEITERDKYHSTWT